MKTFLLGLAISAAAITGPAAAQDSDNRYQDRPGSYRDDDSGRGNMSARIEQLRERIEAGVRSTWTGKLASRNRRWVLPA
ncbi:MAG: hypothetical protein JHD35_02960 [Sphingopyxis sp.]|nr:hypothetical protein [Sphingopyxis sp.]